MTVHDMIQQMKIKHKEYGPPVIVILVTIYIKQVTIYSPTRNGDSNVYFRKMSQLCSCKIIPKDKSKKCMNEYHPQMKKPKNGVLSWIRNEQRKLPNESSKSSED